MYIQVRLLNGFAQPLWYKLPDTCKVINLNGTIVQVPLRTRIVPAIVMQHQPSKPRVSFAIKEIERFEPFPNDTQYSKFVTQLSRYYLLDKMYFFKRIKQFVKQKEKKPLTETPSNTKHFQDLVELTDEQRIAYTYVKPFITKPAYAPTVIHGVTGSGKTEIYKKLIIDCWSESKTSLLLLPEVTLAVGFEHRLRAQLPETIPILSFHSATSAKQKRLLWQHLVEEKPMLIIGVHLPILLPIAHLGIILVDEEHEVGYQEKKHPKINSKEAAIWRAKLYNIPIVLGSATPSLQTLHNIKTKGWKLFQLKKRFAGAFPTIKTVLLSDKKQRKSFWISQPLYNAIKDGLAKKEQTILFLNRRGFSFFVQCKQCTYVFACANCSVSLTLHRHNFLTCHYCTHQEPLPSACPSCKTPEHNFIKKGIGTQQVVDIVQKLFPEAHIARADMDSTVNRKKWQQTMEQFCAGTIDILVGTQTITKGYHFPNVTLVGVLWADLNLNFPVYNAAETTLQQLIQVAGRAGREHSDSLVIIQSMSHHRIFDFVEEINYLAYYQQELASRSLLGYPPCKRFAEIELKHTDDNALEKDANDLVMQLFTLKKKFNLEVDILGPALPPVFKIKKTYMRKVYLKSNKIKDIIALFGKLSQKRYTSSIFFTPNPL